MKRLMILPLLLVVLVSFSANAAYHQKKGWNWWENDKIVERLNLSEDQKTQINDIVTKFDPIYTEARDNTIEKKTAYKEAKSNKATSNADVIKAFDIMWDAKYKAKRIKLDRSLEIREVLSQEQVTALSEIKKAHKDKMMRKHKSMRDKKDNQKKQMKEQANE